MQRTNPNTSEGLKTILYTYTNCIDKEEGKKWHQNTDHARNRTTREEGHAKRNVRTPEALIYPVFVFE